jgi:hypothetical protein
MTVSPITHCHYHIGGKHGSPPIDPSEKTLPRRTRTTLNQLRSTYCNCLRTFQARIGTAPDDLCPACQGTPHTTRHLFSCPLFPTKLTIYDLWKRPREVADFLRTQPAFSHLPPNPRIVVPDYLHAQPAINRLPPDPPSLLIPPEPPP